MSKEHKIEQLLKHLVVLGYYPFQVKKIVEAAIGKKDIAQTTENDRLRLMNILEEYVQLGRHYQVSYSK